MAIRTVNRATVTIQEADELVELRIREGRMEAVWAIRTNNGRIRRAVVPISPALARNIATRATFGTMLDNIRDDTYPRARG